MPRERTELRLKTLVTELDSISIDMAWEDQQAKAREIGRRAQRGGEWATRLFTFYYNKVHRGEEWYRQDMMDATRKAVEYVELQNRVRTEYQVE